MAVATVNGIELNYRLEGDGEETIVLINGLADDLDDLGAAGRRLPGGWLPGAAVRQPGHRRELQARWPVLEPAARRRCQGARLTRSA